MIFRVRASQLQVFSDLSIRTFEERMLVHLNKFFPRHCGALGEDSVLETIRYGIDRAAKYGIVAERDVCKYIDLMFVFGKDFDTDPTLPWAGRILAEPQPSDSQTRSQRLFDTAKRYLERTARNE